MCAFCSGEKKIQRKVDWNWGSTSLSTSVSYDIEAKAVKFTVSQGSQTYTLPLSFDYCPYCARKLPKRKPAHD